MSLPTGRIGAGGPGIARAAGRSHSQQQRGDDGARHSARQYRTLRAGRATGGTRLCQPAPVSDGAAVAASVLPSASPLLASAAPPLPPSASPPLPPSAPAPPSAPKLSGSMVPASAAEGSGRAAAVAQVAGAGRRPIGQRASTGAGDLQLEIAGLAGTHEAVGLLAGEGRLAGRLRGHAGVIDAARHRAHRQREARARIRARAALAHGTRAPPTHHSPALAQAAVHCSVQRRERGGGRALVDMRSRSSPSRPGSTAGAASCSRRMVRARRRRLQGHAVGLARLAAAIVHRRARRDRQRMMGAILM